jgi:hypothetical protein
MADKRKAYIEILHFVQNDIVFMATVFFVRRSSLIVSHRLARPIAHPAPARSPKRVIANHPKR